MPMDFPDMNSLLGAARVHGFREPRDGELEESFRADLADHVEGIDFGEAHEIRLGKGWDKWTEEENRAFVINKMMQAMFRKE